MGSPLLIIVVLVVLVGGTVALWWPGTGLLRRGEHHASRERILTEDALKHIYHGEYRGQTASLPSVAGALQVSLTRAVELAERMQTAGLVTLRDGRLILTEQGNRHALQVIRAHRLWERYLADETGVAPTEWHAKAERREHTMTPEEIDALENKLGHPRFDPHGDPIPTSDGAIRENPIVPLSSLEVGERAHVVHIEDEPEVVFAQLVAIGTYLGMVVHINGKTDERIVFEADGRSYVLAPLLAANISIQRLDAAEASEREGSALTLAELEPGEVAEVDRVSPACRGIERRRLMDLGIVPGTRVEFERRGLTGGLSAYRVRGTLIALRKEQADMISVNRIHEVTQ
jgi:DtxR family Mn-dependent transcriptional regulator